MIIEPRKKRQHSKDQEMQMVEHYDFDNDGNRLLGPDGIYVLASDYEAMTRDRDQISLTLDVAKADRDKWFNRAKALEAALRSADDIEHSIGAEDWYKERDALLATVETPADAWLCVCGLAVKKRYQCLCGGREDNSTSDRGVAK